MTKLDFLNRVASRALDRYGQVFREPLLNDLLKDGLIPAPDRVENSGKAPNYKYSCQAYRRAMQTVRLRKDGIVGRDAQRVILFLRGYSQPVWDVKEALRNEYVKAGKAILSQIRSSYADNTRNIPPKHKDSLLQSMGELDDRLKKSQIIVSADAYIDGMRNAKQRPLELSVPLYGPRVFELLSEGKLSSDMLNIVSGMLMFDSAESDDSETIDYVDKLILNSSDKLFYEARAFYQSFETFLVAAGPAFFPNATNADRECAINATTLSIKNVPSWFCLIFVLGLKIVSNSGVPSKP